MFIKQLEEKNVAHEITFMVWSDRMDLVAFANVKGEVALHRLTWTRAWILCPPKDGVTVDQIAWRPDGKVLAIGYSSGEVILVGIENKTILNNTALTGNISCILWVEEKLVNRTKGSNQTKDVEEESNYIENIDFSLTYLLEPTVITSLDSSSTSTEEVKNANLLHVQPGLNLLLIGTKEGFVHIRIFGCFTCAVLNLNEYLGYKCSIESLHLTEDLSNIFVTVKDTDHNIKIVIIDSTIFKSHTKELYAIAYKYVSIIDLVNFLSNTITNITETWESVLLEIDNKLSKYSSKVAEGGLTADFMDLLMFGICSSEMEEFLIHDLTKKGLEKFGQTIEMSYVNIQKLSLKYVTKFGQSITYHLAELRGMARFENRYKILGLREDNITNAISVNGSFLIKTGEMQQVINHSLCNYRSFFRWLYTIIMHLLDEPIPSEIHKMTQQDLAYITEFLKNFDNIGHKNESKKSSFIMERLGQYLSDGPLSIHPNMEGNDWTQFMKENECLQKHPSILKHYNDMSIIDQYKLLKNTLDDILQAPMDTITQQFKFVHTLNCFNFGDNSLRMSSINMAKDTLLFSFLRPDYSVYLLQINGNSQNICFTRCGKFHYSNFAYEEVILGDKYQMLDIQFFSHNILSVLLQDNSNSKTAVLHQFYFVDALEKLVDVDINNDIEESTMFPDLNGTLLSPKMYKNIVGMTASQFAVSGSRRVGIVLSENKKKIRLFELGSEDDEEEEDADMGNSTIKDSDVSMQESSIAE